MTEKINEILSDLIGLPLTRTTRAVNVECMKFGTFFRTGKEGKVDNIGEFALLCI